MSLQEVEVVVTSTGGSTNLVAPANLEIARDVVAGWEQEAEASKPTRPQWGFSSWHGYLDDLKKEENEAFLRRCGLGTYTSRGRDARRRDRCQFLNDGDTPIDAWGCWLGCCTPCLCTPLVVLDKLAGRSCCADQRERERRGSENEADELLCCIAIRSCALCWMQPWSPYGLCACFCWWHHTYPAYLQQQEPSAEELQRHRDAHVAKRAAEELVRSGDAAGKTNAARALANLSSADDKLVAVAAAGAIAPLVELARGGDATGKEAAARALRTLAGNDDNAVAIAAAGAIAPRVELARGGDAAGKEAAAWALLTLAGNNWSTSSGWTRWGVESRWRRQRVAIVAAGAIAPLVELVRSGDAAGKEAAAAALGTLAGSGCDLPDLDDNAVAIAAAGAIAPLLELVRGDAAGKEAAEWALMCLGNASSPAPGGASALDAPEPEEEARLAPAQVVAGTVVTGPQGDTLDDLASQLERLVALKSAGHLDDNEYAAAKAHVLAQAKHESHV